MAWNLCCHKHHEWNFLRRKAGGGANRRAPHQPSMLAAAAGGPPDQAKMMEIMRRYGLPPAGGLKPQDKVGSVLPVSVLYRRLNCWQLHFG